jgi:hypothetical protein
MDPIKTNFNKAKKSLSGIEVRMGGVLFNVEHLNEFYDSNPDEFKRAYNKADSKYDQFQNEPIEYYLTPEEESAGFIRIKSIEFYGSDKKPLSTSNLFQDVRNEMEENLSLLIDKKVKVDYVMHLIDFYSNIESQIIEDEKGQYYYEEIHLVDFSIDELNKLDKTIYFATIETLKDNLRNEIRYLMKTQFKLENGSFKKEIRESEIDIVNYPDSGKKKEPKTFSTKSFKLNPDLFSEGYGEHEKLKEFQKALLSNGYINNIDYRNFSHSFTGRDITKQIKWLGTPSELFYLMKTLYDKELIVQFKNYWCITCKCFLAYRKKITPCTPEYLQRCKPPTRKEHLRKLNSIIDTLK